VVYCHFVTCFIAVSTRFSSEGVEEMRHTFNICWLDQKLPEAEVQGFQGVVTSLAQEFQKLAALLLRVLASSLGIHMLYLASYIWAHIHSFTLSSYLSGIILFPLFPLSLCLVSVSFINSTNNFFIF
jgi:hypothetical protein